MKEIFQKSTADYQAGVQRAGRFLSGMMMPLTGVFLAWGILVALFAPSGWFPNETLAKLIDPIIIYLIPLLIGYVGGQMVDGARGGVIGAAATIGVIASAQIPMLLGAMLIGPAAAFVLKKVDGAVSSKIVPGFEMLARNVTAGITGFAMIIAAYLGIGPIVRMVSQGLVDGIQFLTVAGLLPLANLLIEPAKVLFLNNAINQGILNPAAFIQSSQTGQSILFLLESNPGPGLGILLAYCCFGKGEIKLTAKGSVVVQFFGGVHEVYFPFVLMRPILLLAVIAGGAAGTLTFTLLQAGLVSVPSPGSIVTYMLLSPKGGHLPVLLGVLAATVVSFLIASITLKTGSHPSKEAYELAKRRMAERKGAEGKGVSSAVVAVEPVSTNPAESAAGAVQAMPFAPSLQERAVNLIVVACDAGMGSSAMGASILRKKFKEANVSVTVINSAINEVPLDADIVITHQTLTERAKGRVPDAEHISLTNFLKSPEYDELAARLQAKSKD